MDFRGRVTRLWLERECPRCVSGPAGSPHGFRVFEPRPLILTARNEEGGQLRERSNACRQSTSVRMVSDEPDRAIGVKAGEGSAEAGSRRESPEQNGRAPKLMVTRRPSELIQEQDHAFAAASRSVPDDLGLNRSVGLRPLHVSHTGEDGHAAGLSDHSPEFGVVEQLRTQISVMENNHHTLDFCGPSRKEKLGLQKCVFLR